VTILKWFAKKFKKSSHKIIFRDFIKNALLFLFMYRFGLENFSIGFIVLFAAIAIWDLVWKFLGMWKTAKRNSPIWFVCMGIFNTLGILPILYLYVFSREKKRKR